MPRLDPYVYGIQMVGWDTAAAQIEDFTQAIADSRSAADLAVSKHRILNTTIFAMGAAAAATSLKLADMGAELERLNLTYRVFTGSQDKANRLMADLQKYAAQTPFLFGEVQKSAQQMLAYGWKWNEITKNLRVMGDLAAGAGAELQQIVAAFNQMKVGNVGMGMSMLRYHGITTPQIGMQLRRKGFYGDPYEAPPEMAIAASSAVVQQRFPNLTKDLAKTLEGQWSMVVDNLQILGRSLGKELVPELTKVIERVIAFGDMLENVDKGLLGLLGKGTLVAGLTLTLGATISRIRLAVAEYQVAMEQVANATQHATVRSMAWARSGGFGGAATSFGYAAGTVLGAWGGSEIGAGIAGGAASKERNQKMAQMLSLQISTLDGTTEALQDLKSSIEELDKTISAKEATGSLVGGIAGGLAGAAGMGLLMAPNPYAKAAGLLAMALPGIAAFADEMMGSNLKTLAEGNNLTAPGTGIVIGSGQSWAQKPAAQDKIRRALSSALSGDYGPMLRRMGGAEDAFSSYMSLLQGNPWASGPASQQALEEIRREASSSLMGGLGTNMLLGAGIRGAGWANRGSEPFGAWGSSTMAQLGAGVFGKQIPISPGAAGSVSVGKALAYQNILSNAPAGVDGAEWERIVNSMMDAAGEMKDIQEGLATMEALTRLTAKNLEIQKDVEVSLNGDYGKALEIQGRIVDLKEQEFGALAQEAMRGGQNQLQVLDEAMKKKMEWLQALREEVKLIQESYELQTRILQLGGTTGYRRTAITARTGALARQGVSQDPLVQLQTDYAMLSAKEGERVGRSNELMGMIALAQEERQKVIEKTPGDIQTITDIDQRIADLQNEQLSLETEGYEITRERYGLALRWVETVNQIKAAEIENLEAYSQALTAMWQYQAAAGLGTTQFGATALAEQGRLQAAARGRGLSMMAEQADQKVLLLSQWYQQALEMYGPYHDKTLNLMRQYQAAEEERYQLWSQQLQVEREINEANYRIYEAEKSRIQALYGAERAGRGVYGAQLRAEVESKTGFGGSSSYSLFAPEMGGVRGQGPYLLGNERFSGGLLTRQAYEAEENRTALESLVATQEEWLKAFQASNYQNEEVMNREYQELYDLKQKLAEAEVEEIQAKRELWQADWKRADLLAQGEKGRRGMLTSGLQAMGMASEGFAAPAWARKQLQESFAQEIQYRTAIADQMYSAYQAGNAIDWNEYYSQQTQAWEAFAGLYKIANPLAQFLGEFFHGTSAMQKAIKPVTAAITQARLSPNQKEALIRLRLEGVDGTPIMGDVGGAVMQAMVAAFQGIGGQTLSLQQGSGSRV